MFGHELIQPSMSPVLTVVLSSEDLRCNVVGCSTESTSSVTWSDPLLKEGEGKEQKEKEEEKATGASSGCRD